MRWLALADKQTLSGVGGEQPHKSGQPDHAPSANDKCIRMND